MSIHTEKLYAWLYILPSATKIWTFEIIHPPLLLINKPGQEDSGDSAVMTLRHALQSFEKSGFIDWTLGGHSCARPAEVQQGKADDMFEIKPQEGNQLLWRATTVAAKQLKQTNVASCFSCATFDASPLICVLWLDLFEYDLAYVVHWLEILENAKVSKPVDLLVSFIITLQTVRKYDIHQFSQLGLATSEVWDREMHRCSQAFVVLACIAQPCEWRMSEGNLRLLTNLGIFGAQNKWPMLHGGTTVS